MNQKTFARTAGAIFALISFLHFLRLVLGWQPIVNGLIIPAWVSWVALAVSGYLAYRGLNLGKESHKDN